jgi:D-alanyl-D-alanine dipeptidase
MSPSRRGSLDDAGPVEDIAIRESKDPLIDLSHYPFVLQPVYYRQGLSDTPRMLVRKTVAEKLVSAQKNLAGCRFKIWDAWRPRDVQNNIYRKFWAELSTEHPNWDEERLKFEVGTFVTLASDPRRIPPHATGGTVDLTLVDTSGEELDMGTPFDHFGPESYSDFFEKNDLNKAMRDNRRLLRNAMAAQGFRVDVEEWWHYDYGNQLWAVSTGESTAFYGEASPGRL